MTGISQLSFGLVSNYVGYNDGHTLVISVPRIAITLMHTISCTLNTLLDKLEHIGIPSVFLLLIHSLMHTLPFSHRLPCLSNMSDLILVIFDLFFIGILLQCSKERRWLSPTGGKGYMVGHLLSNMLPFVCFVG